MSLKNKLEKIDLEKEKQEIKQNQLEGLRKRYEKGKEEANQGNILRYKDLTKKLKETNFSDYKITAIGGIVQRLDQNIDNMNKGPKYNIKTEGLYNALKTVDEELRDDDLINEIVNEDLGNIAVEILELEKKTSNCKRYEDTYNKITNLYIAGN